jgi:catalase
LNSKGATSADPPAPLGRASLVVRLALIGAIVGTIAASFAYCAGWLTPHALTPATMIDAFELANGRKSGFRRNHAKGVGVSGAFESNGAGVSLSKASVFQKGRVPVLGRFALAGGQPYLPDVQGKVRSMALLFELPDGEEWRTGMNDIPVFNVNTAQAFYENLLASVPDPSTSKPDPQKIARFLRENPASAKALQLIGAQPRSSGFENDTFNSLNAFRFVNEAGTSVFVRWSMVAVEPAKPPVDAALAARRNYLFDGLVASIHQHPLQWHLVVTVAEPGDPTNDATLPWPADRRRVDVGTLTIDRIESEATSRARDVNFDPLVLPVGMTASDDPLLSARSAAYSESFTRREGEHKEPSAISVAETR